MEVKNKGMPIIFKENESLPNELEFNSNQHQHKPDKEATFFSPLSGATAIMFH